MIAVAIVTSYERIETASQGSFDAVPQPHVVEISVYRVRKKRARPVLDGCPPFTSSRVRFWHDPSHGSRVTGEVANPYDHEFGEVYVGALLRDAEGGLIGSRMLEVDGMQPKSTVPFVMECGTDFPTGVPASVDVLVVPRVSGDWEAALKTWAKTSGAAGRP